MKLETAPFNAGPEAVEALNGDAIDATFIGPNPAINLFSKSGGKAIRIVSGTTSGGRTAFSCTCRWCRTWRRAVS